MKLNMTLPKTLMVMVDTLHAVGGRCYLVGGSVVDCLQDNEVKDFDVEVFGLDYNKLVEVLNNFGKAKLVGQSFGVVKVRVDDVEFDFSLPRRENKTGLGHKGFDVELVPNLSLIDASRRRDLTVNSMMVDLRTFELIDKFNGYADLSQGIMRHVWWLDSDGVARTKFAEDPLRVLRVMQLVARKGKFVAEETVELSRRLLGAFRELPKERVFAEFEKLLMKSDRPSVGLEFLFNSVWLFHFPELSKMKLVEQNPKFHQEGNVWNHTLLVIDEAAKVRDYLPEEWRRAFMFGMLLHDVGKIVVTDNEFRANGHDVEGEELARTFMARLTDEKDLIEKVIKVVVNHMQPFYLTVGKAKRSAWRRLSRKMPLDILGLVVHCDNRGRIHDLALEHGTCDSAMNCFVYWSKLEKQEVEPVVRGRDLLALGFTEGPEVGKILKMLFELQLETGVTDRDRLLSYLELV